MERSSHSSGHLDDTERITLNQTATAKSYVPPTRYLLSEIKRRDKSCGFTRTQTAAEDGIGA